MRPPEPPRSVADGFVLALGGGGARGYAHIGVIRALAEQGLSPRRIVGTSMGAIVGAGLAAGRDADEMLERLTRVDHHDRVALVAERVDPSSRLPRGLGVARFVRLANGDGAKDADHAEIAVTVIDEVQGRGLGRALLLSLAGEAQRQGVRRFVASVLPENQPMRTLLQKLAPEFRAHREDGVEVYEIPLVSPDGDRLPDASYVRFA